MKKQTAPLSEIDSKIKNATRDECIDELRRIAKLDPEKFISRNFFRANSKLAESAWNRHFGTFDEFKRIAGLTLSRQQQQLEKHIAKHASVDHYRKISLENQEYGELYNKPDNGKRIKTVLIASDLHDEEIDRFALRVFVDTAKRIQPDVICLAGDTYDLAEFGKYGVDPRDWDVVGKLKFTKENILRPLREAAPNAQFDMIEGNHEARLVKHLADQSPAMRAVLSDFLGLTLADMFALRDLEINYITKTNLAAWGTKDFKSELANNHKVYWDSLLVHHFPYAKAWGMPGVNGHHHSYKAETIYNLTYGSYQWCQLGSLHKRSASYCDGEKWSCGFMIAHIDTVSKNVNFEYVDIKDLAIVGGKYYERHPSEVS